MGYIMGGVGSRFWGFIHIKGSQSSYTGIDFDHFDYLVSFESPNSMEKNILKEINW